MNGAPAKPISGVALSSATVVRTPAHGASDMSASASAAVRDRTAPRRVRPRPDPPQLMTTSTPAHFTGTTMSLKKMAARPRAGRTGCSVISPPGLGQTGIERWVRPRTSRYSGRGTTGLPHEPDRGRSTDQARMARTRRLLAVSETDQGMFGRQRHPSDRGTVGRRSLPHLPARGPPTYWMVHHAPQEPPGEQHSDHRVDQAEH